MQETGKAEQRDFYAKPYSKTVKNPFKEEGIEQAMAATNRDRGLSVAELRERAAKLAQSRRGKARGDNGTT